MISLLILRYGGVSVAGEYRVLLAVVQTAGYTRDIFLQIGINFPGGDGLVIVRIGLAAQSQQEIVCEQSVLFFRIPAGHFAVPAGIEHGYF